MRTLIDPHHSFASVFDVPRVWIWTTSSLKLFRNCKRKFFWKYLLRLAPKTKSVPHFIGSAFHEAVAKWYRSRRASMRRVAAAVVAGAQEQAQAEAEFYSQEDWDELSSSLETLRGMLVGYASIYESDRTRWSIRAEEIERRFRVPGPQIGDNDLPFEFWGMMDLTPREGTKQLLVEHKTASKIGESYIERLTMDTQIRGYLWALRAMGLKPSHVVYNVVRKCQLRRRTDESLEDFNDRIAEDYQARPQHYFWREDLLFNNNELDAFEHELVQTHKELVYILQTHDHPENPRTWLPNDSHCNAYFKTCPMFMLCTKGLDRGTAVNYVQRADLHEELADLGVE